MTRRTASETDQALKAAHRAMWAMGDYDRFARATVWELGPVMVEACGVTRGQRVLDVAAGTGNVAIQAAKAGAIVVASDLTPEHFDAGRRGAAAAGVELEWVEGDAEALPFDDATFEVVTSCFGAMRLCIEAFGPLVAIRASLRDQAGRQAELDRALVDGVIRWNRGRAEGPVDIPYEYLLVVAQKHRG